MVETLAPGEKTTVLLDVDLHEWARTPPAGVMVVAFDDKSGKEEAELLTLKSLFFGR